MKQFESTVLVNAFPDIPPQIEAIERMKEDVHGAVLLATTEPKLVATMTKLLEKYGGEIDELRALIPPVE